MRIHALRVIAFATLASGSILAGSRPALAQTTASPLLLMQAHPAPPASVTPAAAPGQAIGLPRVRDYEPTPELRDVHFNFGSAVIRPDAVKVLDANAAWLVANPRHLVLIEGHSDRTDERRTSSTWIYSSGRRLQNAHNRPSRITTLSYGEERPRCSEES
jgi:outer membrane protein OmpA-like peptidoglycan-associated protein